MKRLSLQLNLGGRSFEEVSRIAKEAEILGFHSLMVDDHFWGTRSKVHMDAWTVVASLSVITNKIRLGTLVTCQAFRHAANLAKIVSSIDIISGGRLDFGIGACRNREEHEAFGYSFPSTIQRLARLEETINVLKLLWTGEQVTYRGQYYNLVRAICLPRPVQIPHPPLIIGGLGEPLFLQLVVINAQVINLMWCSSKRAKKVLALLQTKCKDAKRNFSEIEKTISLKVLLFENNSEKMEYLNRLYPSLFDKSSQRLLNYLEENGMVFGTADECVQCLRRFLNLGFDRIFLRFENSDYLSSLNKFAKVVIPGLI